jgi:AcrR family transcriptional regulator
MSKGEYTRQRIIELSAPIFNQQGYFGTSMSDIMRATGLEKGGIYNHFANKEELALAAFDYNIERRRELTRATFREVRHAADRLVALADILKEILTDTKIPGGCAIVNTIIEADDTNPALKERAAEAMSELKGTVYGILTRGIDRNELRPDIDIERTASKIIMLLEGAVVISRLNDNAAELDKAADFIREIVDRELRLITV